MNKSRTLWLQIAVHIAALLTLAVMAWDFSQGQLSANPINEIELRTGRTSLALLMFSLACTPINIAFGFKPALTIRPVLGLYAFAYATLHLLALIGLDYGFDMALFAEDTNGKRFIIAGFAAYLALLPLTITATKGWESRLGNYNWLPRWIAYLAAILSILHYFWETKVDIRLPLFYAVALGILLILRLPWIRRLITLQPKKRQRR